MLRVGVLGVQGDFEKHMLALRRAGLAAKDVVEVRLVEHLNKVDRLILPGGESTTVGLLLERYGLGHAIVERAEAGMPVWGTCMGMILMAREVAGRPNQYRLGLLDVTVERNAFGAQVHSFEAPVSVEGFDQRLTGVFIRSPVVSQMGPGVKALAKLEGKIVAVRQGSLVGTSFHPELTDDTRLHEWFLKL
ncbi:MAG: pyridoxal 5'-phosphate synthase glutaminase subunit PdxT [Fimbriimonas ginsengisoli]|uniref:Pyridoxal 5'-phosphate synthase subunit PdxT n=1 Tax=Fimbriimonas ginsengisoli TaxID=1005039 RepID=A0A931LRQ5_FIMGI|nr:pyridoxal 5'-phosphate synthase glutaminase subunit PdxT [Fimbriimonas ginsengisoli]MBI3722055.1 pyridoxal 5'-phosphate synthase glutaminase subunit PdxT [Fimbriimonas ginsengisoli]